MQEWVGIGGIPEGWDGCVITMGILDGVHAGHRALLDRTVELARELGLPSIVITFDRHPSTILDADGAPAALTTASHKADLVSRRGIDAMMTLRFTRDFSEISPADFVKQVLVDGLRARTVVVGDNFHFGYRATGDVPQLEKLGAKYGYSVDVAPLASKGGSVVSASLIRARLAEGDVAEAAHLLQRPYRVDGIVVRGEQRGRQLGYPTANIQSQDNTAIPADGVYAGRVLRLSDSGRERNASLLGTGAISIGTNPTFDGRYRTVEAFILDFDDNLYGETLGIEFCHRLRGMERFDDIDALVGQMAEDVRRARRLMQAPARVLPVHSAIHPDG